MIKCEKGAFEAQGSNAALKAELAIIIENLKNALLKKWDRKKQTKRFVKRFV